MIKIDSRVKVFDGLLFKNDIDTPLSTTVVPGTVIKLYKDDKGRELVDVKLDRIRFPHEDYPEKHISRGHFLEGVELINYT